MVRGPEPDARPRLIGDYIIHRLLGEGGMGKVYAAQERLSHRPVALKVMHQELSSSEAARRHFLTEMAILSRLDDPHVVRCLHCTEVEGELLMVLELLDGRTLRELLRERGALPWPEVVAYATQISAALRAAHASEPPIIHRDLKPENVMCLDGGRCKVMDFGIAKILAENTKHSSHAMGTLLYMSPEQIDARVLDGRSDLYALGAVMWEMLAGRPPFESESPRILLERICTEPAPPLPDFARASAPAPLQQLVARLLEKEPSRRPSSAQELLAQLDSLRAPAAHYAGSQVQHAAPAHHSAPPVHHSPPPVHHSPPPVHHSPPPASSSHAHVAGPPGAFDTLSVVERAERRSPPSTTALLALAGGLVVTGLVGAGVFVATSGAGETADADTPTPTRAASDPSADADPGEAATASPPCDPEQLGAWTGAWILDAVSTQAIKSSWIGGKSRYEVTLRVDGCRLVGSGRRLVRDKVTWTFNAVGELREDGSIVVDYEVPGRKLDGSWTIAPSGVGTWRSKAGDVSGTLAATRAGDDALRQQAG